jgi:gliding motility-associated-like protein
MKKIILIGIISCIAARLHSQTGGSDRIVISSGGNGDVTIGELIIGTSPNIGSGSSAYFLLGFQQPDIENEIQVPNNIYSVSGEVKNVVSCLNNKDGKYQLNLVNVNGKITIQLNNLIKSDSSILTQNQVVSSPSILYPIDGLTKGNYLATITYEPILGGANEIKKVPFAILENNVACAVNPTTGITPNSDGVNDTWIIEGITEYKDNVVEIFNRWGQTVWREKNYNNTDITFKGLNKSGEKLVDGTYFFVILPDKNAQPIKGWLEIARP